MHIKDIDLNLLRLFDAVYSSLNVSRAAEMLDLTQPAASQGLMRLRVLLHDPLFVRGARGVRPTPRAILLAEPVHQALTTIEQALSDSIEFDPLISRRVFRLHMSDSGEARFLPDLMIALRKAAPGVCVESMTLPRDSINDALDSGRIDFAFGFLPMLKDTQRMQLLKDRYIVMLRANHPFMKTSSRGQALLAELRQLDFVAVRTHTYTLRILKELDVEDRIRLTAEHFMSLPSIVRKTDLAAVMPRSIAKGFAEKGGYALFEPPISLRDFSVSMHWSRRFERDFGNLWLKQLVVCEFRG
jgi:DNA-binding transcriptional LysR family regulator